MSYTDFKIEVSELLGKTITKIDKIDNDALIFYCDNGLKYKMFHDQDCCESVEIVDINGDLEDLIGTPILKAEQVSNFEPSSPEDIEKTKEVNEWGSCTWTFYKFATKNGYVDIRWFGESNGYYSESVDFIYANEENEFKNYEWIAN